MTLLWGYFSTIMSTTERGHQFFVPDKKERHSSKFLFINGKSISEIQIEFKVVWLVWSFSLKICWCFQTHLDGIFYIFLRWVVSLNKWKHWAKPAKEKLELQIWPQRARPFFSVLFYSCGRRGLGWWSFSVGFSGGGGGCRLWTKQSGLKLFFK